MNKEKWINEVMHSLDNVQKAEVNPYLFTRIQHSIESAEKIHAPARLIWMAAASFALLLALNLIIIKQQRNNKEQPSDAEQLVSSFQLLNTSTINYN